MLRDCFRSFLAGLLLLFCATPAAAQQALRIMPPDGATLAVGQRVDIAVDPVFGDAPVTDVRVWINDREARGTIDQGRFVLRGFSADAPGPLVIRAHAGDGRRAEARITVDAWGRRQRGAPRAKNIIFLLGDGMGAAHRTAARIVSRGMHHGKAAGRLAMDTLEVTGMVMTGALNTIVSDSSSGMAAYSSGQKAYNSQQGVFPDRTPDVFDNPRVEYIGELLRRTRGPGFSVGIVTTADVTDSTPAANASHTADRYAGAGIVSQYFDERDRNGIRVLMGGGRRHFLPKAQGGTRADARNMVDEFTRAGFQIMSRGAEVQAAIVQAKPPSAVLGLFHPEHMPVAFDKVGAGRYSDELALDRNAEYRDTPMLEDMARVALRTLEAHSPAGFYLLVEGASIDKEAHDVDPERTIWDTIEFDRAVQVALDFAKGTNSDRDPDNDTLVIVAADHECGGFSVLGVANELYDPAALGRATRDYAAVRFTVSDRINLFPNYTLDERGFPIDPDPSRKILIGWAAAPDRNENWQSDRVQSDPTMIDRSTPGRRVAVPNPERDKGAIPGFVVRGVIEHGAAGCPEGKECPPDVTAIPVTDAGHTATDVPLSATGPGAWQFTGVQENTDVFIKMLRSATGSYERR